MVSLKNVSLEYPPRTLVYGADVEFIPGTLSALIGRNGSGKSTLLRAIAGLNANYSGQILIAGTDIREEKGGGLARKLAFVNTRRPRIGNMTCREVVGLGRSPYTDWIGRLGAEDMRIVEQALSDVNMSEFAGRQIDSLSDGECQRVMIARALAQNTGVLLLDEPTSFLDMPSRYELVTLLGQLAHRQGKTVIFSTHELDIALQMCDMVALIDDSARLHYLPPAVMQSSAPLQSLLHPTHR